MAHVFDAAGNMASSTVEVIVDNQVQPPPTVDTEPPVVSIINPVAGNVSGKVTISVDASDDSGAAGITLSIYIDGTLKATGTGSTLGANWNTRPKRVKNGIHTILAIAKDAAGNSSSAFVDVNVIK